jgi:hypothetical protein
MVDGRYGEGFRTQLVSKRESTDLWEVDNCDGRRASPASYEALRATGAGSERGG